MNIEIVKKHPVATAAIVIGSGVLLYLLIHKSGSGSRNAGMSGNASEFIQMQAASDSNNASANAATEIASIQGQVAIAQTNAQLSAVQAETQTAENIVTTQSNAAIAQTQINADASTQQTQIKADAGTAIANDYFQTNLAIANQQIAAATATQQHTFDIENAVVASAGRDKSRSSSGWAQIIAAFHGQGPQAIAANQASEVANGPGNIIKSITGGITSAFSNFF